MNDIQRLEAIYNAAGRELRRALFSLDSANHSALAASEISSKAREVTRVLNRAVDKWAGEAIGRGYAKGARMARTTLEILGRKPRRPPFEDRRRRLHDDLVVLLIRANNSIPDVVDRYLAASAMAARAVRAARVQEFNFGQAEKELGALAAQAEAQEKSRGWLSRRVRDFLHDLIGNDELIEINGRMYRMGKYAELVARTTMRESQTAATLDLCRQYENDLVYVSDHNTDCDICAEFEGNTYSISGTSPDYPVLLEEPPFHPNCKHVLLATSEAAIEVQKEYGETDLARQIREAGEGGGM